MTPQIKVAFNWLMLAIGIALHTLIETAASLYYHPLPEQPYRESIPVDMHVIYIAALILPLIMAFLTLFYSSKAFKLFSLIYAILIGLLHVMHPVELIETGFENITQVILLLFEAVLAVILVVQIIKWRKEDKSEAVS